MAENFNLPSKAPWDYEEIVRNAGEPGNVRTEGTGEFRLYLPEDTFTDVDGRTLTQQNRAVFTGPRAQANARLCSEAPDLLNCLKSSVNKLIELSIDHQDEGMSKIIAEAMTTILAAEEHMEPNG